MNVNWTTFAPSQRQDTPASCNGQPSSGWQSVAEGFLFWNLARQKFERL